jgi:hypothetical protein
MVGGRRSTFVALDANEDVRSGTVYQLLFDLGLTEASIDQHGSDGPSTFAHGSCPIDGLFVSSTLLGLRCGCTGYWHGHRCLWMDVPQAIAFGHDMPPIVRAAARRLKVEDPRGTFRHTTELKAQQAWPLLQIAGPPRADHLPTLRRSRR